MQRQLHLRSQHAKRGRSGWSGPDTYVAVTIAPEGVEVPKYLNRTVLERRGIQIRYFGEGYSKHRGPKSMLGRAIRAAEEFAKRAEQLHPHRYVTQVSGGIRQ